MIRSAQPSFNTYENQALVGFLTSLAHEIDKESAELTLAAEELPHTQFNVPEGYVPSTAAIFAESAKRLQLAASRFLQFRERLTQLRELYVRTLGIEGEMHPWPLRPTPVFLAITPYREIFEAVSNWRKAPPPGLEEGEMLLTCMANSRLCDATPVRLFNILLFHHSILKRCVDFLVPQQLLYLLNRHSFVNSNCR